MKNKTMLKMVFLSMALSSCGLVEKFKTPEQPTDSKDTTASTEENSPDDLFSKTMDEENNQSSTDNPTNISSNDSELQALQDEFAPMDVEKQEIQTVQNNSQESLPEINAEVEPATYSEAGQVKTYNVQKGETLMQIAFKLYGDMSKWKEIKNMNADKFAKNTNLRTNTQLKYLAPSSPFVWNPSGTPYMIKNGETLGTISSSVYSTPKKWKEIWENNKPLIKNPNVIYAGFTLYYKNAEMADFSHEKKEKKNIARLQNRDATEKESMIEEIQVDKAIQTLSSTKREQIAKAVSKTTSAPKESELDLINNISVPHEQEMEPDIDEEVQTL